MTTSENAKLKFRPGDEVRTTIARYQGAIVRATGRDGGAEWLELEENGARYDVCSFDVARRTVCVGDVLVRGHSDDLFSARFVVDRIMTSEGRTFCYGSSTYGVDDLVELSAVRSWTHEDGTPILVPTVAPAVEDVLGSRIHRHVVLHDPPDAFETVGDAIAEARQAIWGAVSSGSSGALDDVRLARAIFNTDSEVQALLRQRGDFTINRPIGTASRMNYEGSADRITFLKSEDDATRFDRARETAWKINDGGHRGRCMARAKEIVAALGGMR